MFWGIIAKIYNICSKKNHISTIINPKSNLEFKKYPKPNPGLNLNVEHQLWPNNQ